MAASSLLALIDDIATLLDDVMAMTKVAATKTAGVLGDDLALNAQQVAGVRAERELPVVWAVAKGSLINKAILVPAALALSFTLPFLILPLLMVGGAYLCFEGVEKLAHKYLHSAQEEAQHHQALVDAVNNPAIDLLVFEKEKIRGAIRTDFILSAEIIVISLGTVAALSFIQQTLILCTIAIGMTLGVYGLVGLIVKLDDIGLFLLTQKNIVSRWVGQSLIVMMPKLMKGLSVLGTVAMFLVGGGIMAHGLPLVHHAIERMAETSGFLNVAVTWVGNIVVGLVVGALALCMVMVFKKALLNK